MKSLRRASKPAPCERVGDGCQAAAVVAAGLAEDQPRAVVVAHQPRLGGRRRKVHDTADDALGRHGARKQPARIEALEVQLALAVGQAIEEPPGHAVHRRDDAGRCAEQRRDGGGDLGQALSLDGDDDAVLRAETRRIAVHGRAGDEHFARSQRANAQPLAPNGLERRAARHHADLVPGAREPGGHQAADRAGAEDADSHADVFRRKARRSYRKAPERTTSAGPGIRRREPG